MFSLNFSIICCVFFVKKIIIVPIKKTIIVVLLKFVKKLLITFKSIIFEISIKPSKIFEATSKLGDLKKINAKLISINVIDHDRYLFKFILENSFQK